MKLKKVTALCMTAVLAMSFTACSSSDEEKETTAATNNGGSSEGESDTAAATDSDALTYANITLGEDYTDITAELKFLTNRTDMLEDSYTGAKNWADYIAEFNKMYPNIKINVEGITNYADDTLLRLTSNDWGDIMMIPGIDKSELSSYFLSYGTFDEMNSLIRFAADKSFDGQSYGVPITATASGIVYNKKVFEEAGITTLPKTPEEFIAALTAIKEKTDAIPLYTNYASGWALGQWDSYAFGSATGSATLKNQDLLHTAAPFADPGNGTGAYNVFKILYDATAQGLIEDDYMTTDWEGSKGMINRGEIACMVLGSWAYSQMTSADEHPEDVGYMAFPITVDGKQYAGAGADYSFGINVNSSEDNQKAAMVFVKWMTEKSGYSYNEGGIPISQSDDQWPAVYDSFNENAVEFVVDEPSLEGEEEFYSQLMSESELAWDGDNGVRGQDIIVAASQGTKSFDDIMNNWNERWAAAQDSLGIEVTK